MYVFKHPSFLAWLQALHTWLEAFLAEFSTCFAGGEISRTTSKPHAKLKGNRATRRRLVRLSKVALLSLTFLSVTKAFAGDTGRERLRDISEVKILEATPFYSAQFTRSFD